MSSFKTGISGLVYIAGGSIKTFSPISEMVKSDGQEKSTKILISWQELKNQFLSFFVHR